MIKPQTLAEYTSEHTLDCERLLVTLFRGLGPWKESVFLVGGLTPRYLVKARPPEVPPHAGTQDVDVVIDLQILVDTDAYRTLEENLHKLGFERATNEKNQKLSWRWKARAEHGAVIILELLADKPEFAGGKVQPLPTDGEISALNVPHSSIVFDLHQTTEIQAELLGGAGVAIESIKHANLVSFTCLKAFAYDQRFERKDAHDLVYCIEHAPEGLEQTAKAFRDAKAGKHGAVIVKALTILQNRFCAQGNVEGYRKDGPVAVAAFEKGEEADLRDERALRQREASDVISRLLAAIG